MGEDSGTILNGEEQGDARTEDKEGEEEGRALTGEREWCLRLGLKAEGAIVRPVSWPVLAMTALGLSTRLNVSKEGLEDGLKLPEERMAIGRLVGDCERSCSGCLELTEKHRFKKITLHLDDICFDGIYFFELSCPSLALSSSKVRHRLCFISSTTCLC